MTDHETRTEAEVRAQLVSHGACMEDYGFMGDDAVIENGRIEYGRLLDAYAEAVRAAERARLATRVRDLDAMYLSGLYRVRKVDVLRLLTEDTAR